MKHEDGIEDVLRVADRELYRRLDEIRNKIVDDAILKALAERPRDRMTEILKEVYAVRGDPSREHTLVFHGTPEEFAFFKARLDEWAKKRIT